MISKKIDENILYDTPEVAVILGYTVPTVRKLLRANKFKSAKRLGRNG